MDACTVNVECMEKPNPKICEVTDSWPPHSFVERHVSSMVMLGESLQPVALKHADDSNNPACVQHLGKKQTVSILPELRRPFLLSLLATFQIFPRSSWVLRLRLWRMKQRLLPVFKEIRPDLIHFHWIGLAISLRWIPETLGIPYTVSLRGSEVRLLFPSFDERTKQIRTTLEHASGIHTVCQDLGQSLEYAPIAEIPTTTIYTCVSIPDHLPSYSGSKGTIQFLTIGRLHWTKGYPDLLWALKKLKDLNVPWELTMAGYGPDEERIKFWIKRLCLQFQVRMLGKVNSWMVQTLLASSHAIIQSSLSEGLCNSLAEAMANGCPVFATSVGGTAEVVEDRKNGILLTPMKPDTWVEPLQLATDTSLMMKIRQSAHETAKKLFSSSNHADQFVRFYNKAINRSRPRLRSVPKIDSLSLQGRRRKGVHSSDMTKILVIGDWEWAIGVDGVIRVIGGIIQKVPHPPMLKVVGCGSQKTELQYLCNFMNVLQYVEFVELEKGNAGQIEGVEKEGSDLKMICHRYGEVSIIHSQNRLEVENLEDLEKALLAFFELDQKNPLSASKRL